VNIYEVSVILGYRLFIRQTMIFMNYVICSSYTRFTCLVNFIINLRLCKLLKKHLIYDIFVFRSLFTNIPSLY